MVCVECIGEIVIMSYDACLLQACKQDTSCCLHNTGTHRLSAWTYTCKSRGGRWRVRSWRRGAYGVGI